MSTDDKLTHVLAAAENHGARDWERDAERAVRVAARRLAQAGDGSVAPAAEVLAGALLRELLDRDVLDEGVRDTPRRMVQALRQMMLPQPFQFRTFYEEGVDELVVQAQIPFHSLCEHHVLPFVGTAAVGYLPSRGRVVGLSKLARAVRYCAAGLQTQERITAAVADMLQRHLEPAGIGVLLRARHLCMEVRGVQVHDTWTVTSCMRGALRDNDRTRAEFLRLSGLKGV